MDTYAYDRLIHLTLEEKILYSKSMIRKALHDFTNKELFISWTGGKDSTLSMWLFRQVCQEENRPLPKAMFIDEGSVFDEILELIEKTKNKWGVEVIVAKNSDVSDKASDIGDIIKVADLSERNQRELLQLDFHEETFPFDPESLVGNHMMKTVAMNMFVEEYHVKALVTAIRWDEQEARTQETFFSPRHDPAHTRIHPILHFTERDVWDTIHEYEIPFCSLYYEGYRSLGAKCATERLQNIPAWEQDLENTVERTGRGQNKEDVMAQLRALGYM